MPTEGLIVQGLEVGGMEKPETSKSAFHLVAHTPAEADGSRQLYKVCYKLTSRC